MLVIPICCIDCGHEILLADLLIECNADGSPVEGPRCDHCWPRYRNEVRRATELNVIHVHRVTNVALGLGNDVEVWPSIERQH